MTISTQNYEDTYGRKPKGHGAWSFLIGRRPGEYTMVSFTGTYSECLRMAKAEAKQIGGASSITVLS
jgi:hypothetical protein